jgi:hypothetical protein
MNFETLETMVARVFWHLLDDMSNYIIRSFLIGILVRMRYFVIHTSPCDVHNTISFRGSVGSFPPSPAEPTS